MRKISIGYLLLSLSLASGCQTLAPKSEQLALQGAPECCEDFRGLSYKVMTANQPGTLLVNRDDPAFTFEGGKSFVEAVTLPPLAPPYRLQIESFAHYSAGNRKPEIFYPVVTLLDADFQPLETLENLPFEYETPVIGRNRIVSTITFAGERAAARYAIIHSSTSQSGLALAKMHDGTFIKTEPFESMVYAPVPPPRYRIDFGQEGYIRLLAHPL